MPTEDLSARELRDTHPRLRADRLRAALRRAPRLRDQACAAPGPWIELLRESDDPALKVLLLELLESSSDEQLIALLERLRRERADGVRLASLRLLCERQPERVGEFARQHAHDGNLELRVLLGTRLYERDEAAATELLLETLEEEAGGLRERHALERVLGFLVEEKARVELRTRLSEMREDFDDPEDYFGWALAKLDEVNDRS